MRTVLNISRVIVGVLFIFSGLVKANDPLGLSYKMQEFFEIWGWHALNDYTLAFSVAMNAFEIIAGVAILVGWQMRLFSWLLLLLILFFTFLTGYALFSGKVRECGCFGDCIPLTADQSFLKDLILLALIGIIFFNRHRIQPWLNKTNSLLVLFFTSIFAFSIQWYTLQHLPVVDCLPYKTGNNIPEQMKPPANSIPDSTVISFVYKKDGKEVEFTADQFPEDFNDSAYQFVKRYDKVVRKGNAVPKIKDFSLQTVVKTGEEGRSTDTTQALLSEDRYQLFLFLKDGYNKGAWIEMLAVLKTETEKRNIPAFLVTSLPAGDNEVTALPGVFTKWTIFACDAVAIKTAARTNPTVFLVKKGTILNKWSYADLDEAIRKIQQLDVQEPAPPKPGPEQPAEAQEPMKEDTVK